MRADRPWWEGGAAKLPPVWKTGLVACYHPRPGRIDMGMGVEKCGTCRELRVKEEGRWRETTAPLPSR